jgi:S-adenosylmethionine decarboxylase
VPELAPIGVEWIVDARGCDPVRLRDREVLSRVFDEVTRDLGLNAVQPGVWHVFPGPAGVTGFVLLAESHLACHTFPELGSACFNLFCCRPRPPWDWQARLAELLGARDVSVVSVPRNYGA